MFSVNIFNKYIVISALSAFASLLASPAHAQTIAKNTVWLEEQFNKLLKQDEGATPIFTFTDCQMNMALATKDKDVAVGIKMSWQVKDIRKVSYHKAKDGQYTLVLDVPTDRISMAMGFGDFSTSFTTTSKGNHNQDNITSLTLNTVDEAVVRQLKQKIEELVQLCR